MGTFSYGTSRIIPVPAETVRALVNDFHAWRGWSPWEQLDPAMARTYRGPQSGVGAEYEWSGNRKAGAGTMRILEADETRTRIQLAFTKPFAVTNEAIFDFTELDGTTRVGWTMTGTQGRLQALFVKLFGMQRKVLQDFDRGLAALAEQATARPSGQR